MKNIIKAVWHISKKIMHCLHVQFAREINEYDSNGNLIHVKTAPGYECWFEYDANGNTIHYRDGYNGYELWNDYDSDGHMIHYKDWDGNEHWWDADGNIIEQSNEVVK